ncbi:hypothetical protein CLV41_107272 [Roseibium marinum]|uniref:Uncharacterized protein n=1 Tax=Roseibium marinum TaxID=281252 RepID=A0A2S3URA8_9HYPH|nr:hypothetical protein CLV41_107272 [Roseibium marinum]
MLDAETGAKMPALRLKAEKPEVGTLTLTFWMTGAPGRAPPTHIAMIVKLM